MSIWKRLRLWLSISTLATDTAAVGSDDLPKGQEMKLHLEPEPDPEARARILERQARSQRHWRYRAGPWQQK